MITFIAFLLTLIGCVNWLLIGLLQYDFIAGMFGFQASIFSRLCYILIGVGALYLVIRIIVNKGNLKVYEKKKKKETESAQPATATNVEAGKEQASSKAQSEQRHKSEEENYDYDYDEKYYKDESDFSENNQYFDEHYKGN